MEVFRISKCKYIHDLSGNGAMLYGGRWNSKGYPVVYASGSRSLAALEVLVHLSRNNLTDDFCIACISVPDQVQIKEVMEKDLPAGWWEVPIRADLQEMGNSWLKADEYCVLKVPSVVISKEWNYLINPSHPDARKIKIKWATSFLFDARLQDKVL